MRVYLSVDMEGIAGVNHPAPTDRADARYPEKVGLMVAETNAAIEGALAGGATEVVVNDSHGDMHNLLPEDVHPAATLVQGQKAWSMVAAADPTAGGRSAPFTGGGGAAGRGASSEVFGSAAGRGAPFTGGGGAAGRGASSEAFGSAADRGASSEVFGSAADRGASSEVFGSAADRGASSEAFGSAAAFEPFGVALFVGYHARAGHPTGTIAHTYSSRPTLTRLDGRLVGETGLNALVLGAWGIPVGLVAGDDALADEVREWLPWAERVIVKHGVGRHAAESLHPSVARDLVRKGAERAVRRAIAGELRPLVVEPPISVELEMAEPVGADYAAIVPGGERIGDRGVRFVANDPVTAYRSFLAAVRLASLTHR